MATELKPLGVAVVSLYPGLVRTERVREAAKLLDFTNPESPEFIERAIAALAADPDVLRYTGKVLVAAALAMEYGFTDIERKTPPLRLDDVWHFRSGSPIHRAHGTDSDLSGPASLWS